jgi:signal transduction histidine kinase/ActR/RegA family two-component response regulator
VESESRARLRMISAQSENANPIVALAAVVLIYTMYGRVETQGLLIWAAFMGGTAVWRFLISRRIRARVPRARESELRRYERVLLEGTAISAIAMGSAFWLIAMSGDLYARMVVTLISMVHMVAVLLYLTPHFKDRIIRTAGNVGQGMLFWLGLGTGEAPYWEILVVYVGLFWCVLVFGREQLRQFHESLRVRNENALLLRQLEADREVIQNALTEARQANESKSRFLAAASHDLRQPLHALTMFLGTLGFHVTSDDARRLLGRVQDTVSMLEEQFNSLLDMSRFDVGAVKADQRPFRLDAIVQRLVEEFRPVAEGRSLLLTADTPVAMAQSDFMLIGRLLRNLIDNAVKYTSEGQVSVHLIPQEGAWRVEVVDTGPGIAPEQQHRIFDEYVQLSNPARQRRHGVGLGLAIVKRIDNLLGLQLKLHSIPGQGSRFSIVVPAASAEAVELQPRPMVDAATFRTDAHVWALDDDPMVLDSLRAQLEAWGAHVRTFTHPEDLLAAAAGDVPTPEWVLTDDMLGDRLSGLQTAKLLARDHGISNVCLITGNTEPERLAELRASGFAVIVKPAAPEQLIALMKRPASLRADADSPSMN